MGNPNLPIGFVFSPAPEIALKLYLKKKILNQHLPADFIPTVDIFSCGEPRLIPFCEFELGPENEWHFFTNKRNENRIQTTHGCWEEIKDDEVQDSEDGSIGFMRQLVFKYSNPEDKEDEKEWYIHEYRANPANFTADELVDDNVKEKISNFVLCKVFCEEPFNKLPSSSDDSADDKEYDNDLNQT